MRPGLLHILLGCVLFLLDPGSALGLFDSLDSAGAAAPTDSFRFAFPTSSPTRGLAEGATSTSEPSSYYTSSSYGTRPPITANSTGHPASPASKESPLSSVATTSSTVSTELASSPASSHAQNQSTVSSTQLRETVTSTNGEPTPATVMSRSTTAIVATAKRRKARRRKACTEFVRKRGQVKASILRECFNVKKSGPHGCRATGQQRSCRVELPTTSPWPIAPLLYSHNPGRPLPRRTGGYRSMPVCIGRVCNSRRSRTSELPRTSEPCQCLVCCNGKLVWQQFR
ncbi:uncharacterized protein LOC135812108 isoform X1 [Sycon ciliatum]|uniref:uncharacterized protein LOC135812108 isoform X1 n=1 Tax=Sycon ciliatum TaxID=27933 RepID=UPI0031F671DA